MTRERYEHTDPDDPLYDPEDDPTGAAEQSADSFLAHFFSTLFDDPEQDHHDADF